jgi:NADP-dependent 3-hydroxy acid dehydrogenase YdfG
MAGCYAPDPVLEGAARGRPLPSKASTEVAGLAEFVGSRPFAIAETPQMPEFFEPPRPNSNNRVAVITGGGSGVGAALALALAEKNTIIYLIGRRLGALEAVGAKAKSLGATAACYSANLASESDQLELTRWLTSQLSHIDVLVQNAAMCVPGSVESSCLADFDRHYQTNVRAPYMLTKSLLPMLKKRCGQVVFINSSSGFSAKPMFAQYDSTKHALRAIADSLRAEVNTNGIRVLSVYLGRTATEMQAQLCRAANTPYLPESLLQPEDVASIIRTALHLPRTAEVTDLHIRPMIKPSTERGECGAILGGLAPDGRVG